MNKKLLFAAGVVVVLAIVLYVAYSAKNGNNQPPANIPPVVSVATSTSPAPSMGTPYLQYTVNLPNGLVLTDSEGRRTGKDPVTGAAYNEIPGASYQEQGDADLYFPHPPAGSYKIQIVGPQAGNYVFSNEVFDGRQAAAYQVLHGTIPSNQAVTFSENYDPNNPASSTVTQN